MKAKILRTEHKLLGAFTAPYHIIRFERWSQRKVFAVDCSAWEHKREMVEKYVRKNWYLLKEFE